MLVKMSISWLPLVERAISHKGPLNVIISKTCMSPEPAAILILYQFHAMAAAEACKCDSTLTRSLVLFVCLKNSKEKEKACQGSDFIVSVISLLNVHGIYTQKLQVSRALSQKENGKQCLTASPPINEPGM